MNTNWCLSKLAATLSATAASWDDPQAASTPCVFTVCATQRDPDAASAIEKKTVKILIRQTISFSQRYSRSLTLELTRRRESIPIHRDRRSLRNTLPPLGSNDLILGVGFYARVDAEA